MKCTVRFGICFLRVPQMYQLCYLVLCCQGRLTDSQKRAKIPIAEFTSSLSIVLNSILLIQGEGGEQAHLPVGRLLDLPLVPRHGEGVIRERGGESKKG